MCKYFLQTNKSFNFKMTNEKSMNFHQVSSTFCGLRLKLQHEWHVQQLWCVTTAHWLHAQCVNAPLNAEWRCFRLVHVLHPAPHNPYQTGQCRPPAASEHCRTGWVHGEPCWISKLCRSQRWSSSLCRRLKKKNKCQIKWKQTQRTIYLDLLKVSSNS